jgi:hypothetical protein
MTNGFWGGSSVEGKPQSDKRLPYPDRCRKKGFQFWDGLGRKWERKGEDDKADRVHLLLDHETWFEHGNVGLPVTAIIEGDDVRFFWPGYVSGSI